ncbi:MAG TPA: 16S rRNA (cytosine(1402)-N(4))-methyltransferase RsmH [Flavobacteriales bacterium]|nr:16S rRNA (cytosine(1402)-N(4))-methyltransferase RsmH [Flavobacteriales bacterium]
MKSSNYHTPVLLHDAVEGLNINPLGTYVDVTFGGGGHSAKILEQLTSGKLYAFDQDPDAQRNLPENPNLIFIPSNFRFLENFMQMYGVNGIDGLLADLGVSSHQFDDAKRGFSFRFDARLDMRMDTNAGLDACTVVNTYEEEDLANMFYLYGELRNSRAIAKNISIARREAPIETTGRLQEVLKDLMPERMRTGFFAQVFQALRIEVNHELDVLVDLLEAATKKLNKGGRLVIISYHSLEDRLVKNFIRSGNVKGELQKDFYGNLQRPLKEINKKPIVPGDAEIKENNRARSAKLRIAEKI